MKRLLGSSLLGALFLMGCHAMDTERRKFFDILTYVDKSLVLPIGEGQEYGKPPMSLEKLNKILDSLRANWEEDGYYKYKVAFWTVSKGRIFLLFCDEFREISQENKNWIDHIKETVLPLISEEAIRNLVHLLKTDPAFLQYALNFIQKYNTTIDWQQLNAEL
jgi:hypothetical protein